MAKPGYMLFLFLLCYSGIQSNAQEIFSGFEHLFAPVKNHVVYKISSEIIIDGNALETSWEQAEWTDEFQDIEGILKPTPKFRTRAKMLWDEQNLYILAELEEPHVWSYIENHDAIVYHENDFEVFIDPDSDARNYFEIEINARNTIFDLFMPKPYRSGGPAVISWNANGIKTAISVDGTLNNPGDTDKKWMVEMAIPFEALRLGIGNVVPIDGQNWKINFSRVQWQTEIENGKYTRKTAPENDRLIPEDNWVWSPIGVINMHYPERWGRIQFSEKTVGVGKDIFQFDAKWEFQKYLWLIYYKQVQYQMDNGKYATHLAEINMPETFSSNDNVLYFELVGTELQYTAILKTAENTKLTINQDGFIR